MESRTAKIFLTLMIFGGIIWIGGLHARALVGFNLLEMGTLDFKPNIHPYVERVVFSLVAQSSMVVDCAYVVVWVSGIFYLRFMRFRFKENGWLLMCAILFYMFTPVEIYTTVLDMRMWLLDHAGSNDLVEFRKLFIHRLAALSGVPTIALLSYYTVIVVAIFRPFRQNRVENSND